MGIAIPHEGTFMDYAIAPQFYAAPEILRFHGDQSEKKNFNSSVDIFSFGLVMNELFTYSKHSRSFNDSSINFQKKPPFFTELIEKCISEDKYGRPKITKVIEIFTKFDSYFWEQVGDEISYINSSTTKKDDIFIKIHKKFMNNFNFF